jgi:hypothetical protein
MSKQLIPGNNAISVSPDGYVLYKRPHGTFFSSVTQPIITTTASQVIAFERETDNEGLIHSTTGANSRVYVPNSGSYEINVSGIANLSVGTNHRMHIWLKVDGNNVNDTNTIVNVASSAEQVVAVSLIDDLNAGQYVELGTWGDNTACQWLATTAMTVPDRPASPSVIMTVKQISSRLSYE